MFSAMRRQMLCVSCLGAAQGLFLPLAMGSDSPYQRVDKVPRLPISKQGIVTAAPSSLVRAFGAPTDESWDSESLGGYYFTGPGGEFFSVYFRAYDESAASIRALRKSFWFDHAVTEFSLGALATSDIRGFHEWIDMRVDQAGHEA